MDFRKQYQMLSARSVGSKIDVIAKLNSYENIMNLFKKLLKVKEEVTYLKKNSKSFGYNYANGTAVLGSINPILVREGLLLATSVDSVIRTPIEIKTKSGIKVEHLYELSMTMTWIDSEDGEKFSLPWYGSGVNGEEKGYGSALTYAERYFMLKFFQIPTDELDPDTYERTYEQKGKGTSKAAAKAPVAKAPAAKSKTDTPNPDKPSPNVDDRETLAKAYSDMLTRNKKLFTADEIELMTIKDNWTSKIIEGVTAKLQVKIKEKTSK
jgi:hypothetical protein